jgi:WD40 repeat protein
MALNRKGPGRIVIVDKKAETLLDTSLALPDVHFIGCVETPRSVIAVTTRGEAHRYSVEKDSHELTFSVKDRVYSAALSPDGALLAISYGTDFPILSMWDIRTKQELWKRGLRRLQIPRFIEFSTLSTRFAFSSPEGLVHICNSSDGQLVNEIKPPRDLAIDRVSVASLRFLEPEDTVAISYYEPAISIYSISEERHQRIRNSHERHHRTLASSRCHSLIAAGDEQGVITIYNAQKMVESFLIDSHETSIGYLVFSPDGGTLASLSAGNKLVLTGLSDVGS